MVVDVRNVRLSCIGIGEIKEELNYKSTDTALFIETRELLHGFRSGQASTAVIASGVGSAGIVLAEIQQELCRTTRSCN